jgi:hypothetical protein
MPPGLSDMRSRVSTLEQNRRSVAAVLLLPFTLIYIKPNIMQSKDGGASVIN